jgi:hypothetical protein
MAQGELNEGVNLVLVGNAAATLMMTGCIWLIQVLVYPIMSRVGAAQFPAYEAAHISGVTLVVGPLMLAEAITSLLLIGARPASVPVWMPLAGMACVAVVSRDASTCRSTMRSRWASMARPTARWWPATGSVRWHGLPMRRWCARWCGWRCANPVHMLLVVQW